MTGIQAMSRGGPVTAIVRCHAEHGGSFTVAFASHFAEGRVLPADQRNIVDPDFVKSTNEIDTSGNRVHGHGAPNETNKRATHEGLNVQNQGRLVIFIAVDVGAEALFQQFVLSAFVGMKLVAEIIEIPLQRESALHVAVAIRSLDDQSVHFRQELRMFGFNTPGVLRETRAPRNSLIQTSTRFLLGEVLLQLASQVSQDLGNVGIRRVPVRASALNDYVAGLLN